MNPEIAIEKHEGKWRQINPSGYPIDRYNMKELERYAEAQKRDTIRSMKTKGERVA